MIVFGNESNDSKSKRLQSIPMAKYIDAQLRGCLGIIPEMAGYGIYIDGLVLALLI
jgi:hypothetical protein